MSDSLPKLRVRRGAQVFGPLTLVQVAELLAAGRLSESDLVSDGGEWVTVEAYIARQGDAPVVPTATVPAEPPPRPASRPAPSPEDKRPLRPAPPPADEPIVSLSDADDDRYLPPLLDEIPATASEPPADSDDSAPVPLQRPAPPRRATRPARKPATRPAAPPDDSSLDDALRKLAREEQQAPSLPLPPRRPRRD